MPESPLSKLTSDEEEEQAEWLVTYADMTTLLLTFFIMLLSMSQMHTERFQQAMTSIQYSMGAGKSEGGQVGRIDLHESRRMTLAQETGVENEPLMKDMRQMIKKKNLEDALEVSSEGNKIVVNMRGGVLFGGGATEFQGKAKAVLDEVAKLVDAYPEYRLDVKGHTDSTPIHTEKFDSNWELSALRATAVLRYLILKGLDPRRLTATGYADTEPLVPNSSEANRQRNRRVEFVLEKR